MSDIRRIGVMDSGMGGLSVLRALREELPSERFLYWGDNRNAPYGVRSTEEIRRLTLNITDRLLKDDIKALVIACNTITSVCVAELRSTLSIPVFGLEPALKPAAEYAKGGKVVVLATDTTLALEKYRILYERFGRNAVSVPAPRLVELVEAGETDTADVRQELHRLIDPHREELRAVVLGCTHYVWLKRTLEQEFPEARAFDGNSGISRHVRNTLGELGLLAPDETRGDLCICSTLEDAQTRAKIDRYMSL